MKLKNNKNQSVVGYSTCDVLKIKNYELLKNSVYNQIEYLIENARFNRQSDTDGIRDHHVIEMFLNQVDELFSATNAEDGYRIVHQIVQEKYI